MKIADLPAFLMPLDEIERLRGFAQREPHGRLVEDDQLGVEIERAGDRHALLFAARHGGDDVVGMHCGRSEAHMLAHQPGRLRAHSLDVEQAPARARLAPHEHVAPDRLLLAQRALLVDGLDAETARPRDRPVVDAPPVEIDLSPGIRPVKAHHDLHQRRLAGAVVAEQADDLAVIDGEIHPRTATALRRMSSTRCEARSPAGRRPRRTGFTGGPFLLEAVEARQGPAPRGIASVSGFPWPRAGRRRRRWWSRRTRRRCSRRDPRSRTSWSGRC